MPIKTLNFKQSLLIGAFIYVSAALLTACQKGIVANPKDENIADTIIHSDNVDGKPAVTPQKVDPNSILGNGLKKVLPAQPNQACDLKMKNDDIQIMEENLKILARDFKISLKRNVIQDLTDVKSEADLQEAQKKGKVFVDVFGIKSLNSVKALSEQVENIQLMISKYKKTETNPGCFTQAEDVEYPAILNALQRFLTLQPEVQKECDDEKMQSDLIFIASAQKALEQKGILLNLGILAKQPKQSKEVKAEKKNQEAKSEEKKDETNSNNSMEIEILKQLEARLQSLEKVPSIPAVDFENAVSVACSVPVIKLKDSQDLSLKDTVLVFDESHINKKVLDADITNVRTLLRLLEVADDGVITKAVKDSQDGIDQEELPPLKEEAPTPSKQEVPPPTTEESVKNDPAAGTEKSLVPATPAAPVAPVIPAAPQVKAIPEFQRKGERMGVNTQIAGRPSIPDQKVKKESKKSGKKSSGKSKMKKGKSGVKKSGKSGSKNVTNSGSGKQAAPAAASKQTAPAAASKQTAPAAASKPTAPTAAGKPTAPTAPKPQNVVQPVEKLSPSSF